MLVTRIIGVDLLVGKSDFLGLVLIDGVRERFRVGANLLLAFLPFGGGVLDRLRNDVSSVRLQFLGVLDSFLGSGDDLFCGLCRLVGGLLIRDIVGAFLVRDGDGGLIRVIAVRERLSVERILVGAVRVRFRHPFRELFVLFPSESDNVLATLGVDSCLTFGRKSFVEFFFRVQKRLTFSLDVCGFRFGVLLKFSKFRRFICL